MARITDEELQQAMEACAAEPAHTPGNVQPFACLLAGEIDGRRVLYASENCPDFLGLRMQTIFQMDMRQLLGREIWHEVSGALQSAQDANAPIPLGKHRFGEKTFEFSVLRTGDCFAVEIEEPRMQSLENVDVLKTLRFLTRQIQKCTSVESLFNTTCETMRHVTGYDRVMVYRFDAEFNGEVLAEARNGSVESFLGLRFPHWDIPAQARALMEKIPLRMIQDVDQVPVGVLARDADQGPLDMTFAASRGVSAVHMEYLRNVGVQATMTLTVMLGDRLWGILSFHHRRKRIPATRLREVLISFAELFAFKLQTLEQEARLRLVEKVDALKSDVLSRIDADLAMEEAFGPIAATVLEFMDAQGVALLDGSRTVGQGDVPGQATLSRLAEAVETGAGDAPLSINNLGERFPDLGGDLGGIAGVLAVPVGVGRVFCIFRKEVAQDIHWAGNPEKTIERADGRMRLAPRGSFSAYLQQVKGRCEPWSDQDLFFARQIWHIVNIAERRALMNTLSRQQKLMIDELNHRVRNILALVRSVSRQARRHDGSLDSYTKSVEARIHALAAAHDLASGSSASSVSLHHLVQLELEPYAQEGNVVIEGPDRSLRADVAPVFALVVHELVTNASKYGALSTEAGQVRLRTEESERGLCFLWSESGGPPVEAPKETGFGTVLIQQAVPHEMGGHARLQFLPDGVQAEFVLPDTLFDEKEGIRPFEPRGKAADAPAKMEPVDLDQVEGIFMVLEDNFMIADEMREQLLDFGAKEVEVFSNVADALEFLEDDTPRFAFLDVNLGGNTTSEAVALNLWERGVPFAFVTGYGEAAVLPEALQGAPRLTKPVANSEIETALQVIMSPVDESGAD